MTNKKTMRRSLFTSVVAMLICISMFAGTTFAWFTDSVTSANNVIKSGSLDVELEYWNGTEWKDVNGASDILTGDLWEPGYVDVAYLRLKNAGSLALKYQLGVNIISETAGVNKAGDTFKLSDYIYFDVVEGVNGEKDAYADRDAAMEKATETTKISKGYSKAGSLEANSDYVYLAMVVYMPTTVGNVANHNGTDIPEIDLGINVFATQYTSEEDSFNDQYDADALVCDILATPETIDQILATVKSGTVIGLAAGKYGSITLTQDKLTLVSNSAVVDYVNANAKDNCKLIGITFDAAGAQMAYGMTSTSGVNTALDYYTNVTGAENSANGADNLQIINCTFTGTPVDADNYVPVSFYERNRKSGGMKSATIDGCTFETNAAYYIYAYYPGYQTQGEFKVTNNTFGGANTSVGTAVYFGSTQGNVSVIGNTFVNGSVIITPHNNASCTYALMISVIGNNFINTGDTDMTAIGLRNFYDLPKCSTLVRDNVANFGLSAIKAPYVDGSQYECYDASPANVDIAVVNNTADLTEAIEEGGNVFLIGNINYNNTDPEKQMILESENAIEFNGNGNTITVIGANPEDGNHGYVGFVPIGDEKSATVSNLTVTGTGFVELGDYNVKGGTYVANNLVIENLVSTLANTNGSDIVGCAFMQYGTGTLNNCVMTGTTALIDGVKPYDAGFGNSTTTTINGGEYGVIRVWEQAHVTINGAEIGTIDSRAITTRNLGMLTIGAGTHVGTINLIPGGTYTPALIIEEGATVDAIVYNGVTYTQAEWLAR